MFKKIFSKWLQSPSTANSSSSRNHTKPIIIPRDQHNISRKDINNNALKVLYRLQGAGYGAFLVGGCVRDLLIGRHPKDFDIATDALPEDVHKLFRNSRMIGRRFRLVHIVFGKEIIEVATFRRYDEKEKSEHHARSHKGMILRDNVYGTIEEDAWRRDFTINALYYNIADFSVVDYTGGMQDLAHKVIRMIGDPEQRFHEDPVRLLRAIRIMGKLQLTIDPDTQKHIIPLTHLLEHVSSSRLFQEILKFFVEGASAHTFKLLEEYRLLEKIFPQTVIHLENPQIRQFIETALLETDARIEENQAISPAFLLAVLLWPAIANEVNAVKKKNFFIYENAIRQVLKKQTQQLAITNRLLHAIHDICTLQYRFTQRGGFKPLKLISHPRFKAGFDFLILREKSGEPIRELVNWWKKFYSSDTTQREFMLKKRPRKKIAPKKTLI